jgi:hypothetical protein
MRLIKRVLGILRHASRNQFSDFEFSCSRTESTPAHLSAGANHWAICLKFKQTTEKKKGEYQNEKVSILC